MRFFVARRIIACALIVVGFLGACDFDRSQRSSQSSYLGHRSTSRHRQSTARGSTFEHPLIERIEEPITLPFKKR